MSGERACALVHLQERRCPELSLINCPCRSLLGPSTKQHSWTYCQDPAGCEGSTPAKTCAALTFKGAPAYAGACPSAATAANASAAAWASGLAKGGDEKAAARAAKAYCDKQAADAKKTAIPVRIDVSEVMPESAG